MAVTDHRDRLRSELLESEAPRVVTLGEEARRVLMGIADAATGAPTKPLTQRPERDIALDYGERGTVEVDGRALEWMALVHPGQRSGAWSDTHDAWIAHQA